jgi:hypothetical protein
MITRRTTLLRQSFPSRERYNAQSQNGLKNAGQISQYAATYTGCLFILGGSVLEIVARAKTYTSLFSALILALSPFAVSANEAPAEFFLYGYEFAPSEGDSFTRTKTITTGDHHCESSCKGEPTRTGYRIEDRAQGPNEQIVDASLSCDSGLCAFSQVISVNHNTTSSYATFDVWSRPMNWTLTTTFVPIEWVQGDRKQIDNDRVEAGSVFLIEHDRRNFIGIDMDVEIPNLGRVRMNPSSPLEPYFSLINKSTVGFTDTYSIRFNGTSG